MMEVIKSRSKEKAKSKEQKDRNCLISKKESLQSLGVIGSLEGFSFNNSTGGQIKIVDAIRDMKGIKSLKMLEAGKGSGNAQKKPVGEKPKKNFIALNKQLATGGGYTDIARSLRLDAAMKLSRSQYGPSGEGSNKQVMSNK